MSTRDTEPCAGCGTESFHTAVLDPGHGEGVLRIRLCDSCGQDWEDAMALDSWRWEGIGSEVIPVTERSSE